MKKVKFYFKLVSTGELEDVAFFPEDAQISIKIKHDSSRKKWENTGFELYVDNPFEYVLIVFGLSGTQWEAELKIVEIDGSHSDFLKWSGITGDTTNNISRRTKPVKNIPQN